MIEPAVVPPPEWGFANLDAEERERWLGDPPHPLALLDAAVAEADAEAVEGRMTIAPDTHRASDARRVIATFAISPRVFDQLINGGSGYRAQYYLSPQLGRGYNRRLVDALVPAVKAAFDRLEGKPMSWAEIERSLAAPDSKLWPAADSLVFSSRCGRSGLRVLRWENYWRDHKPTREASGVFANLPSPPLLALKGTFFLGDERQPSSKDRDRELHERGYT